ncbi:hypothetical protein M9H77_18913 [Catharanthus roseus]|uniref:Uncharacterized protein n=1 Tax=Catharanthus roseus TaxID=4058 RepID=A0ACC0B8T1_CATRO|nr:hypothetical protein M9H77_18913 [Catharanthus roseus]
MGESSMVGPGARRGDNDLGPVTERTGRVEGRVVTASSRGVRGCHSTSDILSTPASFRLGIYYDSCAPGSSTQPPTILFRTRPPLSITWSPPPTSYDLYAHVPALPRMPSQDWPHCMVKTQVPLNDVSGPGLQLSAQFFEHLVSSVPVDSFYSGVENGATDLSFDARLSRDSGQASRVDAKKLPGCWSLLEAQIVTPYPDLSTRSASRASSDDVDWFFTIRLDPLEDGVVPGGRGPIDIYVEIASCSAVGWLPWEEPGGA